MKRVQGIFVIFLSLILSGVLNAEEYKNVEVKKLITSTTSSNGQPLTYLQAAQPEVTVLVVRVPPKGSTGWHKHPVPVYAYMLEGTLNVEIKGGRTYVFKKGDAILEVMNTLHNGYNSGDEPARLVVFYTGAVGVPNVVKEGVAVVPTLP
ncbi:MAG: cupin domain-containing protein [Chlorobiales bacterium]|nr:cupin domain-containing protein [Chlorobiales bacterium]